MFATIMQSLEQWKLPFLPHVLICGHLQRYSQRLQLLSCGSSLTKTWRREGDKKCCHIEFFMAYIHMHSILLRWSDVLKLSILTDSLLCHTSWLSEARGTIWGCSSILEVYRRECRCGLVATLFTKKFSLTLFINLVHCSFSHVWIQQQWTWQGTKPAEQRAGGTGLRTQGDHFADIEKGPGGTTPLAREQSRQRES